MQENLSSHELNSDFCVISCYYNPINYKTRRFNFDLFIKKLEKVNVDYRIAECIFPGQSFSLPKFPKIIRFKSNSILWQRERLINLVSAYIPKSVKFVAWIDCDLIFSNNNWVSDTLKLLNKYPIVQLFERCIRLPKEQTKYSGEGKISLSFASVTKENPKVLLPESQLKHGLTGGAWAMRREILDSCGLYEYAITGGADDYMAHAIFGDLDSDCVKNKMCYNHDLIKHYKNWAKLFFEQTKGKTDFVPGDALHLWHGELKNRNYFDRHNELEKLKFNPYRDIISQPGNPLEWSNDTSIELRNYLIKYFCDRKEDE